MLTAEFQKLNPEKTVKTKIFSTAYVLEPITKTGHRPGSLFLVLEIDMKSELAKKIAEIIFEVLKREHQKINSGSASKPADFGEHFEEALKKTNQALATLASEGYVDWIDKTHVAIAAIDDDKLYFSGVGKVKIFLQRQKNLINVNQTSDKNQPTPMKTFANVVSGSLVKEDKLILVVPQLFNVISENELREMLLSSTLPTLIKKLKQRFSLNDP